MSSPPDPPSLEACRHHWRLTSPSGPTVRGVCRRCGAERDFPTTTESNHWETGSERQLRQGEGEEAPE